MRGGRRKRALDQLRRQQTSRRIRKSHGKASGSADDEALHDNEQDKRILMPVPRYFLALAADNADKMALYGVTISDGPEEHALSTRHAVFAFSSQQEASQFRGSMSDEQTLDGELHVLCVGDEELLDLLREAYSQGFDTIIRNAASSDCWFNWVTSVADVIAILAKKSDDEAEVQAYFWFGLF